MVLMSIMIDLNLFTILAHREMLAAFQMFSVRAGGCFAYIFSSARLIEAATGRMQKVLVAGKISSEHVIRSRAAASKVKVKMPPGRSHQRRGFSPSLRTESNFCRPALFDF